MLPLWQPLSTVALILVVMEIPSLEGYWDEERPEGELASGRGGGLSKIHGGADVQLQKAKRRKMQQQIRIFVIKSGAVQMLNLQLLIWPISC